MPIKHSMRIVWLSRKVYKYAQKIVLIKCVKIYPNMKRWSKWSPWRRRFPGNYVAPGAPHILATLERLKPPKSLEVQSRGPCGFRGARAGARGTPLHELKVSQGNMNPWAPGCLSGLRGSNPRACSRGSRGSWSSGGPRGARGPRSNWGCCGSNGSSKGLRSTKGFMSPRGSKSASEAKWAPRPPGVTEEQGVGYTSIAVLPNNCAKAYLLPVSNKVSPPSTPFGWKSPI